MEQDFTKEIFKVLNNWERPKIEKPADKLLYKPEHMKTAEEVVRAKLRLGNRITALEIAKLGNNIYNLGLKITPFNVMDPQFWERECLFITENHFDWYNNTNISWEYIIFRQSDGHPFKLKELFEKYHIG